MANKKILIIDDDESMLKILDTELSKIKYTVLLARDGIEGLEMVKNEAPDLIILDIMLPKKDGYEVLKEVKADNETKDIPVIMLTGLGLEEDIEKGINLGAEHYLTKPLRTKILLKCLETTFK